MLDGVHTWLSDVVGATAVAALAGALSGGLGVVVYRILSNQDLIRLLKQRGRELRRQIRSQSVEPRDSVRLAMANLRQALILLGHVAPSAIAGGAVMIPAMYWLDGHSISTTEAECVLGGWEPPFVAGALAGALLIKRALRVE